MLVGLQLVMAKGVFHLLARVNVVGDRRVAPLQSGEPGVSASFGMDCAGVPVHRALGLRDGGRDESVSVGGIRGGGLTLVLFIAVVVVAVRVPLYLSRNGPAGSQWICWCLFASVAGHLAGFFGVSYFGQIHMLWYMTLAMVDFCIRCGQW